MAVYKGYHTRRKKVRWSLLILIASVLVIFAATVWLGSYLSRRAANPQHLPLPAPDVTGGETITPIIERTIHGEYVLSEALADFSSEDPFTYASTVLYRGGVCMFASETDRALGKDVSVRLPMSAFDIEYSTTGLFYVGALDWETAGRSVVYEYELSLIREFCASRLGETVLVFGEVTEENIEEIFEMAEAVGSPVTICVPYALLHSPLLARFFARVSEGGYTAALCVDSLTAEQLAADIEEFAFYFTKYNLRLVLEGEDEALLSVLSEASMLNYQFCSPRLSQLPEESTAESTGAESE